jgi:glycerol-3-phosphate dehydrogenase
VLVNAAGPWVSQLAGSLGAAGPAVPQLRLVKGSHIVVPAIPGVHDAYLCQAADGRVVFAIPYEERFTLVGTTEIAFSGDPQAASIDGGEGAYLLELAARFFAQPPLRSGIVWSYAGVRPLYDEEPNGNASAVSRDYRFDLSDAGAPLLTVLGGKLTTYRRLAEAALAKLAPFFPHMGPAWTRTTPLPGGDLGSGGLAAFIKELGVRRRGFTAAYLGRLARRYGTRADEMLGDARDDGDLGEMFGAGLSQREVAYMAAHEWAREPDDVLWRRTKCGLHLTAEQRNSASEAIAKVL